jgi:hypothetical protein
MWEPAVLAIKREGYSIKCNGQRGVVLTEKFQKATAVCTYSSVLVFFPECGPRSEIAKGFCWFFRYLITTLISLKWTEGEPVVAMCHYILTSNYPEIILATL